MLTSFRAAQMSTGAVQAVYWAVTALMGVSLSLLLFTYTGASVARTFFVTGAAFGALSLYGYTTKRDLSAMGKWLFIGAVMVLVAGIANFFIQSSALMITLSVLAIGIFSAFILYDLKRVQDGEETNYITATLSVYMSIYNVFQSLLSLLGIFGGERD